MIIHLPESVALTALSATVSNAEEFGDWLTSVRGGTSVIVDEHRPVPLWQHMLVSNRLYDMFASPVKGQADEPGGRPEVNPELIRVSQRDATRHRTQGQYSHHGARSYDRRRQPGQGQGQRPPRFVPPRRAEVIARLDRAACSRRSRSSSAGPAVTRRCSSAWPRTCA